MGNVLKNSLLLFTTLVVCVLLSEGVTRWFFHPVDYLQPHLEHDDTLNGRISPGTGGHDDWGFRNYNVPSKAEIVAIGDSQTYGVSATFLESWPTQLSEIAKTTVYNMGLGGYGPLHYLHLLKTKALQLHPKTVVVGLYFGNDLSDAYRLAYTNDNWGRFRNPGIVNDFEQEISVSAGPQRKIRSKKFLPELRHWLSKHSVLYGIVTQSVFGNAIRERELKAGSFEVIDLQLGDTTMFFTPGYRIPALDLNDPKILEGIKISERALTEIKQVCKQNQIYLIVVLIPTKDQVYADVLLEQRANALSPEVVSLFRNETEVLNGFKEFLEEQQIGYVDALPALRAEVSRGDIIYPAGDGHPNHRGYSIIAQEVNRRLGGEF